MNTVTASPVAATPAKAQAADGLIDVRLAAIRYAREADVPLVGT